MEEFIIDSKGAKWPVVQKKNILYIYNHYE